AQPAIQYEMIPLDGEPKGSPFAGYPTPETEAAWGQLMKGINIKIFPDEMERLGYTSLVMKDGSGFLGALGVYHELHCIKRLRKWIYRDYFYPNMTEIEYEERSSHAEHCLEQIRQSAVCRGDITVTPFHCEGILHQCVKWDGIAQWAKSRRVDLFDKSLLVPESRGQM
ncbi:hypothetical protein M426DRAFT_66929, partial [Hypoxylon sp. CI-4A]